MRQVFAFLSDIHAPFHDPRCILLARERLRYLQPSLIVFGGDVMDCYLEGRFVRVGSRVEKLVQELEASKWVIDTISEAAPGARKIMLEGNHEFRHKAFIANMAAILEGYPGLSLEEGLGLAARGVEYVHSKAGNASVKIGPLLFSHGERYGVNPARMELMDNLCSGVSGHVHRMTEARVSSSTSGVDWKWLTSGCLSLPGHYRDRTNEHLGFVSGWIDERAGTFHIQHETIHAEGAPYGRATLYAPEGEYYTILAPNVDGGFIVKCASDKATKADAPKPSRKVGKAKGKAKKAKRG